MRARLVLFLAIAAACGHEAAWSPVAPPPAGPPTTAMPRRLTYNTGDDRSPAFWLAGSAIAFSRYDPVESAQPCIAVLPVEGGTLTAMRCPPPPSPADTFVSTWTSPALSPDGRRVAFHWSRSASAAALGPWTSEIVVAPVDSPRAPIVRLPLQESFPQAYVNSLAKPAWTASGTVRFLATIDSIVKVKGGGAERYTDTFTVARFVAELDPATGALTQVAGGDSAIAWTPGASNDFWTVRESARLIQVAGGTVTERGAFTHPIADIALVNGLVVATLTDTAAVEWLDPTNGNHGLIAMPGPVRQVSAAGGRRFVAEVERGVVLFGAPANLWLYEVP